MNPRPEGRKTELVVLGPQDSSSSYIANGEGFQEELYIQERNRVTANLQARRDGVRRTNTTAFISHNIFFFLMVLELTRSQRTQS